MIIHWQVKDYKPENVTKRYVKQLVNGTFAFCEVGMDKRYDIRQGLVMPEELPESVRNAAIENAKVSVHYVEWPLT